MTRCAGDTAPHELTRARPLWRGGRNAIPNFFEPDWVAPRYAAARPDVHSQVVAHLRSVIPAGDPLEAALDVGCGTGLSTRPLRAIAPRVVGVDPSPAMLREAIRSGGAAWAPDLIDWLTSDFWAALPDVPRNSLPEVGLFDHPSFELVDSRHLDAWVAMDRETLLVYLTTQSGAVAAIESGARSLSELESILRPGLSKLLPPDAREMRFGGPVWVVRPASQAPDLS